MYLVFSIFIHNYVCQILLYMWGYLCIFMDVHTGAYGVSVYGSVCHGSYQSLACNIYSFVLSGSLIELYDLKL